LGVALVATKLEVLEAARSEELAVFFQLEPHAERHARQPAPAGLALGFADQRSRDALPSAGRIDGDAADVERVVLHFPQDGADDDASTLQHRAPTARKVRGDDGGGLLQGARRRVGRPRLRGERAPDEIGDNRGIRRGRDADRVRTRALDTGHISIIEIRAPGPNDPRRPPRAPAGAADGRIFRAYSPAGSGRLSRRPPGSRAAPSPARCGTGEWS